MAERRQIIKALQRLGIPRGKWPTAIATELIQNQGGHTPGEPFSPPAFNPYEQTPDEWKACACAEFQEYLDRFLKGYQACVNLGIDEPVQLPKQRRNRDANIDERYEWAALKLVGYQWKEIALQYRDISTQKDLDKAEDAVRKSAHDILRAAGLDTSGNKETSS